MKTQTIFDGKVLPLFQSSKPCSDLLSDLRQAARVVANGNPDNIVCSDDVRKLVKVPENRVNVCGAIFREDCWEQVSYIASKRPEANGRRVGVYRYHANRDKQSPTYREKEVG